MQAKCNASQMQCEPNAMRAKCNASQMQSKVVQLSIAPRAIDNTTVVKQISTLLSEYILLIQDYFMLPHETEIIRYDDYDVDVVAQTQDFAKIVRRHRLEKHFMRYAQLAGYESWTIPSTLTEEQMKMLTVAGNLYRELELYIITSGIRSRYNTDKCNKWLQVATINNLFYGGVMIFHADNNPDHLFFQAIVRSLPTIIMQFVNPEWKNRNNLPRLNELMIPAIENFARERGIQYIDVHPLEHQYQILTRQYNFIPAQNIISCREIIGIKRDDGKFLQKKLN